MSDEVENPTPEVAPQESETQPEQAAPAEESANAPSVPEEKEELILGKFKSQEDLVKSYQELEQKTTKTAQEKAQLEQYLQRISSQEPEMANDDVPYLDPDSARAVDQRVSTIVEQRLELEKAREFERKHENELKDSLVRQLMLSRFDERNRLAKIDPTTPPLDREKVLSEVISDLNARTQPQVKEAQAQGEATGAKIAQDRARLGNIGETASPQKVNPDELSADEFAKYHNLPRA